MLLSIGNFPITCGSVIYRYGNFHNLLPVTVESVLNKASQSTWQTEAWRDAVVGRDYQHLKCAMLKKIMCRAVASGPAGPVLAGPLFCN